MDDRTQLWNELRGAARRRQHPMHDRGRAPAIRPPRCRPRISSRCCTPTTCAPTSPIRRARQRSVRALEGPRRPRPLLRAEGDRRHLRRRDAVAAPVRFADPRAPGAGTRAPVGGGRDRVARARDFAIGVGMALALRLDGARRGLGDDRGLRDGGRIRLGGHGDGVAPRAHQPDRDPRPQRAGAARAHDARLGRRCLRRASGGVRVERARDRRPRRGGDRRGVPRGDERRPADDDRRADREGSRRSPRWPTGGLAREGAAAGAGRARRSTSSGASERSRSHLPSPSRSSRSSAGAPAGEPRPPSTTAPSPPARRSATPCAWLAGQRPDVVVLDGEVGNSTYTEDVEAVAPERFFEVYIAEQTMVGAQIGHAGARQDRLLRDVRSLPDTRATTSCGWRRSAERTFGSAARTREYRSARTALRRWRWRTWRRCARSTARPSLYPADGNATVRLVTAMCDLPGISYIRTTREATPSLYGADEEFPIGGSKTLRRGSGRSRDLVGGGRHAPRVRGRRGDASPMAGVTARVIDCYSVKPIDAPTLRRPLEDTGLIVVVEDHRVEGGIGDAVLDALAATGPLYGPRRQAGRDRDARLGHAGGAARLGRHRRRRRSSSRTGGARPSEVRSSSSRARRGHATQRERDDLLGRHRAAEQIALPHLAAAAEQERRARPRSRSPRPASSYPIPRASSMNAITMLAALRIDWSTPLDERTVDLQQVDRDVAEPRRATSSRCRSRRSRCGARRGGDPTRISCARSGSIIADDSVTSTTILDGSTPPLADLREDPRSPGPAARTAWATG